MVCCTVTLDAKLFENSASLGHQTQEISLKLSTALYRMLTGLQLKQYTKRMIRDSDTATPLLRPEELKMRPNIFYFRFLARCFARAMRLLKRNSKRTI